VIAVEPRGNSFLQKSVGAYFRAKLKRVGIDLDDQGRNQRLAEQAWSSGLATVDLSAASDTVSRELVFDLLPVDWACYMDALRCRRAEMPDGSSLVLEKFSSMGNGFTFELETLIFWALTSSVEQAIGSTKAYSVYGDDIICSDEGVLFLRDVLGIAGFTFNDQKSFWGESAFRESCGKHYFQGVDVTPCYQKESLDSLDSLVRCHNRLMRWAHRLGLGIHLDSRIKPAVDNLKRSLGTGWGIPYHCSDGDDAPLLLNDETHHPKVSGFVRCEESRSYQRGFSCRVRTSRTRLLPAFEPAVLSWVIRTTNDRLPDRPLTELPYWGDIAFDDPWDLKKVSRRWVVPTGDFWLSWN
jgi:hypothetical protein